MQRTISLVTSLHDRRLVTPNITAQLNQYEKNVWTSMRKLCEAVLYGRIAVKKPLLGKQNRVKRLQWAKVLKDWTIEQWNKVFWTDESKFEIFVSNRRVYVWQRVATPCIIPTAKHRGGSVMVWGFCQSQSQGFAPGEGQIESDWLSHLKCGLWLKDLYSCKAMTQSLLCQRYIKSKEEQHVLQLMFWLAQSADVNLIELVWD